MNTQSNNRRLIYLLFFFSIISHVIFPILCTGQTTRSNLELQVKAAYIYNFTKFVYWDTQEGNMQTDPIIISVIGTDPIGDMLDDFSKKQKEDLPIIVKKIKNGKDNITDCHLVFIGQSEQQQLSAILQQLKRTNVLTVSDMSGFAQNGGMIGFIIENGRVRIEINLDTVHSAGLKISAKLLEVAKIVPREE